MQTTKTLKQWKKSGKDLEEFLSPGDWISVTILEKLFLLIIALVTLFKAVTQLSRKTTYYFIAHVIEQMITDIYISESFLSSNNRKQITR